MTQQILQAARAPGGSSPAAAGAGWAPRGPTGRLRPARRGHGGAGERATGGRPRQGTAASGERGAGRVPREPRWPRTADTARAGPARGATAGTRAIVKPKARARRAAWRSGGRAPWACRHPKARTVRTPVGRTGGRKRRRNARTLERHRAPPPAGGRAGADPDGAGRKGPAEDGGREGREGGRAVPHRRTGDMPGDGPPHRGEGTARGRPPGGRTPQKPGRSPPRRRAARARGVRAAAAAGKRARCGPLVAAQEGAQDLGHREGEEEVVPGEGPGEPAGPPHAARVVRARRAGAVPTGGGPAGPEGCAVCGRQSGALGGQGRGTNRPEERTARAQGPVLPCRRR